MNINLKYIQGLPVAVIHNYFDWEEYKQLTEFIFNLNPYMWHTDPTKTKGATEEGEGKVQLKKNYALFLDTLYTAEGRKYCPVLNINRKLFKEVAKKLIKINYFFTYLESCTKDTTALNYYENKNLYDFHKDTATLTANYIFFKTPKNFTGGEFNIENKIINKPENNTMIIFPSFLKHKVETVLTPENKRNQCLGRFAMTQFCM